jgi:hypothetical protein
VNKNNNMTAITSAKISANIHVERLGVVASPHGRFQEEGVLNPAVFQDRDGNLVMIMRSVAVGNQSRLETLCQIWKDGKPAVDASGNEVGFERVGFALVPQAKYERRRRATTSGSFELVGGEGCEDARVTFIAELDLFVMCYTAFGFDGPRIALATSQDGYKWKRLGLVHIPSVFGLAKDDKDAAFFPEPVFSPSGEICLAMYHRPMVNVPVSGTLDQIQSTFKADPTERQCVRIAYIPLAPVKDNLINLLNVTESDPRARSWCKLGLLQGWRWHCANSHQAGLVGNLPRRRPGNRRAHRPLPQLLQRWSLAARRRRTTPPALRLAHHHPQARNSRRVVWHRQQRRLPHRYGRKT